MYKILVALDKIIAPILCFTSQEIWDFLPKTEAMNKYVVFEDMPKAGQYAADDAFKAKWAQLIAVRDEVKKVLEQARADKQIGASLEASVTLYCNDAVYDLLNSIPMDELADLMIVSHVELVKGEGGASQRCRGPGRCRCTRHPATSASAAGSTLQTSAPTLLIPPCAHAAPLLWRAKPFRISGGAPGAKGGAAFFQKIRRNYGICYSESGLCGRAGGIDQAIKLWAAQYLAPVEAITVIPHVVELRFVLNQGMAFSC